MNSENWFDENRRLEKVVPYASAISVKGIRLPLAVQIKWIIDDYCLDLECKHGTADIWFAHAALVLNSRHATQQIPLTEKGGN